ncbi:MULTISPECIES: PhoH family protein [Brachymonas]|uniref:PhoH family protein n=1 Tax=Brachymonas TaxID=28219 RepID=UPI002E762007|nr:PhoH family protein [Brachymonas sp. J145]MEE1653081.1 PhoH family protein [Brachymonas sp. J145]
MPLPPAPKKRATKLDAELLTQTPPTRASQAEPADTTPVAAATTASTDSSTSAPKRSTTRRTTTSSTRKTSAVTPSLDAAAAVAATAPTRRRTAAAKPAAAAVAESPPPASTVTTQPAARPAAAKPVAATPVPATRPARARKKATGSEPEVRRLFVLDTNVLMHDPMCLFRFEEHDIFLPLIVLEELDSHKKGMTEVSRNARQTSRTLDALVAAVESQDMSHGMPLDATGHKEATGRLFFQTEALDYTLPSSLPQGKADNQILGVVHALEAAHKDRQVALVSKDINMRVKARALGLLAEDYENDKTLDDDELLYNGILMLPADFWDTQEGDIESWQEGAHTYYRVQGPLTQQMLINQFVYFEQPGETSLYTRVTEIRGNTAVLKTLRDHTHPKHAAWGVTARNREQNFAMNLLLDPEIDFVTLTGTAGTGKTLLALACGLTQVLDDRRYTEIIMTRATVSVGEDIGFLPGTEEEKMGPWMGALDDNLEFLTKGGDSNGAGEWGRAATNELIRSRIKIKSMNFMRGRTFLNKFVIIDEAQNLTPKQMKTLITRAGPGTKIICMGNLAQIDTPYLTEGSSGLTAVVDKFKGWPHSGHIMLARGERSRLADFASEVL